MKWNNAFKREIPSDWDNCVLGDYIGRITNGLNPRKNFVLGSGDNYYVTIRSLTGTDIDWNNCDRCDDEALGKINNRSQLQVGDVIFSAIGTIGRTYYIQEPPTNWNISETSFTLRPKEDVDMDFFYALLRSDEIQKYADKGAMGSTLRCLVMDTLCSIPTVQINKEIIHKFATKVKPIFQMIYHTNKECRNLMDQRNELLPLLMNGQVSVTPLNSDLVLSYIIEDIINQRTMKESIIQSVVMQMQRELDYRQIAHLKEVLAKELQNVEIQELPDKSDSRKQNNKDLLDSFVSAKKIEGCSDKTLIYYRSTIEHLFESVDIMACHIETSDIRQYLVKYQEQKGSSKVTIDNMRRIFSSFFAWLEDEDYIAKSPVRRIHKVKTDSLVKEVLTDEQLEQLRDNCSEKRDLAMIDLLTSTGIRVGELVKLNRKDIDFHERQCVVFGKGSKERMVYFNARTKLHLLNYLAERSDDEEALFVSLSSPHSRLTISGVETRIKELGKRLNMAKVHPHKFRRTMATMAIDKGMPIEQVQKLLGHVRIDTTLRYAIVNQNNVKMAHKKYLG